MTDLTLKCFVHQPNPEDKEHVLAEPKYQMHRNGAILYALILSPSVHFAFALISGGTEGTWHF